MATKQTGSKLLRSEDYWAIWLGALFLLTGIIIYVVVGNKTIGKEISVNQEFLDKQAKEIPFKTIAWYRADNYKSKLTGANTDLGKSMKKLLSKPKPWKSNPFSAFISDGIEVSDVAISQLTSMETELQTLEGEALSAQQSAVEAGFSNTALNRAAEKAAEKWNEKRLDILSYEKSATSKPYNLIPNLFIFGFVLTLREDSGLAHVVVVFLDHFEPQGLAFGPFRPWEGQDRVLAFSLVVDGICKSPLAPGIYLDNFTARTTMACRDQLGDTL